MDANKARQLLKEAQIKFSFWDKEIEMRAKLGRNFLLIATCDNTIRDHYTKKGFMVAYVSICGRNYLEIKW